MIIKPYNGYWSVPGGRIRKGEKIMNAIIRIAKKGKASRSRTNSAHN